MNTTRKDKKPGRPVSIWMSEESIEKAERLAAKGGLSKSRLLANVLEVSLGELEFCNKVGILSLGLLLRDMQEAMRAWSSRCQESDSLRKA